MLPRVKIFTCDFGYLEEGLQEVLTEIAVEEEGHVLTVSQVVDDGPNGVQVVTTIVYNVQG